MIVVETGTGTDATANSYADLATIRTSALVYGITLNGDDDALTISTLKAMRWMESFWSRYSGTRTVDTQPLSFPRTGICIRGQDIDANTIPQLAIDVLVLATANIDAGGSLFQTAEEAAAAGDTYVTKKRLGPMELTYGQLTGGSSGTNNLGTAGAIDELTTLLHDLFGQNYVGGISAVRW